MTLGSAGPHTPAPEPRLPGFVWLVVAVALSLAVIVVVMPLPELSSGVAGGGGLLPSSLSEATGARLFVSVGCGACHTTDAATVGRGPGLAGAAARAAERVRAADYKGQATDARSYLTALIADHCADPRPGFDCTTVPELGLHRSSADIEALVNYVAGLSTGGQP